MRGDRLRPTGRVRLLALAGSIALLGVSVGIVAGAIPGGGGTIAGCYQAGTGALRVIDADGGATCDGAGETPIWWNRSGPAGPTGPQGAVGPTGPQGPSGVGLDTFDDLAGLPCRVGSIAQGSIVITYGAQTGAVSLTCAPSSTADLTVGVQAGGTNGRVTADLGAIDCGQGGACVSSYPIGQVVTLTASVSSSRTNLGIYVDPDVFVGWGGACAGRAATCTVTVTQAASVTARFAHQSRIEGRNLSKDPMTHTGTLIVDGIDDRVCDLRATGACSVLAIEGDVLTVTAKPSGVLTAFDSWAGGVCGGNSPTCTFPVNGPDRWVYVAFKAAPTMIFR